MRSGVNVVEVAVVRALQAFADCADDLLELRPRADGVPFLSLVEDLDEALGRGSEAAVL